MACRYSVQGNSPSLPSVAVAMALNFLFMAQKPALPPSRGIGVRLKVSLPLPHIPNGPSAAQGCLDHRVGTFAVIHHHHQQFAVMAELSWV
jgi:hypothetical protein